MVSEATIDRLIYYGCNQRLDDVVGPETYNKILNIARSLECLKSDPDNPNLRHLWIKTERGSIDEWMTFEDFAEHYWDDGSIPPSEDDWYKAWNWELPDETCWHFVESVIEDDYVGIGIDKRCVFRGFKGKGAQQDFEELLSWLDVLACSINESLSQISDGSYASLLDEELPYDFRWGILHRKDFWAITGEDGKRFGGKLAEDVAQRVAEKLRCQPAYEEMPGLDSLTMEQYFQVLKQAYIAAGFSVEGASWRKFDENDPRVWYCRIGDDRDDKLFEIDQNSEEALAELLAPNTFLKHAFEVIQGRGCARVRLTPEKGKDGLWRLRLGGHFDFYADEMALMWEYLNDAGIPTYLYNASSLAEVLLGEDWVFLAPKDEYVDYLSGNEKFGRRVGIALHLWDSYKSELINATEWIPLDIPELAVNV